MNYVIVLTPQLESPLMAIFLKALYEPTYIYQCTTFLGILPVSSAVKEFALQGLSDSASQLSQYSWAMEAQTGSLVSDNPYVLSERRESFAHSQIYTLLNQVKALNDAQVPNLIETIEELQARLEIMSVRIKALEEERHNGQGQASAVQGRPSSAPQPGSNTESYVGNLDDDVPLQGLGMPVFAAAQESQLQAALVLAVLSFTCWVVYILYTTWRFCLEPIRKNPETIPISYAFA